MLKLRAATRLVLVTEEENVNNFPTWQLYYIAAGKNDRVRSSRWNFVGLSEVSKLRCEETALFGIVAGFASATSEAYAMYHHHGPCANRLRPCPSLSPSISDPSFQSTNVMIQEWGLSRRIEGFKGLHCHQHLYFITTPQRLQKSD